MGLVRDLNLCRPAMFAEKSHQALYPTLFAPAIESRLLFLLLLCLTTTAPFRVHLTVADPRLLDTIST